jgi:hypothetical protein
VKEVSAYAQSVSTPVVIQVLKGGGAFGAQITLTAARTEVTQTPSPAEFTSDGDYWDLQVVSGAGSGLTVEIQLWLTGI